MEYTPNDLTHRERYKVLTGFVLPRPIAWITTIGSTGVVNAAPFSFFNVFCEAHAWMHLLKDGTYGSVEELADANGLYPKVVRSESPRARRSIRYDVAVVAIWRRFQRPPPEVPASVEPRTPQPCGPAVATAYLWHR